MTARQTRAYNSTVYTSPVFDKTQLDADVRWNQSPGGLVLLRSGNAAPARRLLA